MLTPKMIGPEAVNIIPEDSYGTIGIVVLDSIASVILRIPPGAWGLDLIWQATEASNGDGTETHTLGLTFYSSRLGNAFSSLFKRRGLVALPTVEVPAFTLPTSGLDNAIIRHEIVSAANTALTDSYLYRIWPGGVTLTSQVGAELAADREYSLSAPLPAFLGVDILLSYGVAAAITSGFRVDARVY